MLRWSKRVLPARMEEAKGSPPPCGPSDAMDCSFGSYHAVSKNLAHAVRFAERSAQHTCLPVRELCRVMPLRPALGVRPTAPKARVRSEPGPRLREARRRRVPVGCCVCPQERIGTRRTLFRQVDGGEPTVLPVQTWTPRPGTAPSLIRAPIQARVQADGFPKGASKAPRTIEADGGRDVCH